MKDRHLAMVVAARKGGIEIMLSGFISERASMDPGEVPGGQPVTIDAGGVLSINSAGVRTWVGFLEAVAAKSPRVRLRRLPPVLVCQASMVTNFLATAEVESFFTPWCCVECGHETLVLQDIKDLIPDHGVCPECSGQTEFDDIRESYLAFREQRPRR
jgi:hypothetical protein